MAQPLQDVLAGAMRLLALREHSRQELRRKLVQKGHESALVESVVMQLAQQGLQSDARFVESFINSRRERGQGPKRIRLELQPHDIEPGLIEDYLDERDPRWRQNAARVRVKKFGQLLPAEFKERMKQVRFLEYRGFTNEQIRTLFNELE